MMGATRQAGALLRTTRPRQWIKNLSVFLPLLFTINEIWTPDDPAGALEFAGLATGRGADILRSERGNIPAERRRGR